MSALPAPTPLRLACAIQALSLASGFQQPADRVLQAFFRERHQLGRQDRAFVAEVVYAVLRRWRSLQARAGTDVPRPLVLAALTSVFGLSVRSLASLAGDADTQWLAGLRARAADPLPPAVAVDLPDWLYQRLLERHGAAETERLAAALNQPAPLDLRVNTLRASREEMLARLREMGWSVEPTPWSPAGLRVAGHPALAREPLHLDGTLEVQDEGSQLLALLLAPRRRERVADFCAGAGGKTLALGALMQSTGSLYAMDISERRLRAFEPRLRRSGLSNVHPMLLADGGDARLKRFAGKFDRVLVDAPCSGLGTVRRNPDMKWRQGESAVADMARRQRAILDAAARLVRPGGRIVYATCSLLHEENDAIVDDFLAASSDFTELDAGAELVAQGVHGLETGSRLRLFPHRHGTDGFFAAALQRANASGPR